MSRDRLTHSGGSQNLREQKSIKHQAVQENEAASQAQFNTSPSEQQLRSSGHEENTYRSEDHGHTYQNQSQSFNEQRSQYAEQALNEQAPPAEPAPDTNYHYQPTPEPEPEKGQEYYHRYISEGDSPIKHDQTGGEKPLSLFEASDYELADATGNYLNKNSDKFAGKLDRTEEKAERTNKRINRLESRNLDYRISYRPWKHRLIMDEGKALKYREYEVAHNKGLFRNRTFVTGTTRVKGRLKFRSLKIATTEKKHSRKTHIEEGKATLRQYKLRQGIRDLKTTASGSEFSEDELSTALNQKGQRTARAAGYFAKHNYRRLKHEVDGYRRLSFQQARLASLNAQKEMLQYRAGIDFQKRKAEEASRQGLLREKQKRKIKKEMVQKYKREQGSFIARTKKQHELKKTVKKEKRMAKKRAKTIISSALGIMVFLLFTILMVFMICTIMLDLGGETVVNTVSQNDYYDMTDVTKYFRNKEAELEEYLKPDSTANPGNLESVILSEEPDIYEFVYDLAEISFDANTLVAYLSARYNEFELEMIQDDLDEIFELYYTLEWEIKEEYREEAGGMVKICYITLTKADFYELLQGRIEDAAKQNQMDGFYLSGNGQQIYGPVMNVDWRNKISSNYGYRIHPITGERVFHDGVDIAVPTGTALYSAVEGTVVDSHYSDSAGNMIIVENGEGWRITFMHMDSRAVSAGDTVKQGQYVGTSGNTGNSTGPHLHIRVHDAEDQPINPVFIVPFSTVEASES